MSRSRKYLIRPFFAPIFALCTLSVILSGKSLAMSPAQGVAPWVGKTLSGTFCQDRGQAFGPYDYLTRHRAKDAYEIVVSEHFIPETEALVRGKTGHLTSDIDYTLRAWPNHHRALMSIIRYELRNRKNDRPTLSPVECYLQRAINYSPKDSVSVILYAIYLQKKGHNKEAYDRYVQAEKMAPENPELHYNFGLLLVSMKRYDEARTHAIEAYKRGYPLPGLKRKLKKLGFWSNPTVTGK